MLGVRLVRLVEKHSEEITDSLLAALRTSELTKTYRELDPHELRDATLALYAHLEEWLLNRSGRDVESYFTAVGTRRAAQKIPSSELAWALMMSKAELWMFVYRECAAEKALELHVELEFLLTLDRFFDRAIYFALKGYEQSAHVSRAA
jgi:hypothetical protein